METMLITFFDMKCIVHLNSFHKAKQSSKLSMWKYLSDYVKLHIEKA